MNKKKTSLFYGVMIVFLALFQAIYHHFSHGVTSVGLQFAWILPLLALSSLWFVSSFFPIFEKRWFMNFFNATITLLVNELVFKGILDIAGGDSPYLFLYCLGAGICLIFAIGSLFFGKNRVGKHVGI